MGNVIIGQSGGPTAVINSSLAGAVKAAKVHGVEKVYGMRFGIEGFLKENLVDMDDYIRDFTDLSLLKRTPSAFLGSCRYKLPDLEGNEEVYEKLFSIMEKYDIEYFLYTGGNDSMDTINKLHKYARDNHKPQKFMGIPKTIDNDLPITDHCPGYGSAAKFVGTMMAELICDNESFGASKPTICIAEIMGRNAGWLTAASLLAKNSGGTGPHMIYCPEVAFDMDNFMYRVRDLVKKDKSIVIAVSEGVKTADGKLVCELNNDHEFIDAFGHRQLSGTSRYLANLIANETGYKTRAIEFSTLQRCANHIASRSDIDEAFNVGYIACREAIRNNSGKMVTLVVRDRTPYDCSYDLCDVNDVANHEKMLPTEWIINDGTYISDDFLEYVTPLVTGTILPYYADGIPKHMNIVSSKLR